MQVYKYVNIQLSKYTSINIGKNVSMKNQNFYKFPSIDYAIMWICQVYQYVSIHR